MNRAGVGAETSHVFSMRFGTERVNRDIDHHRAAGLLTGKGDESVMGGIVTC